MRKWLKIWLLAISCWLLTASPTFAQTLTKFGSNIAYFNSPEMMAKLREVYNEAGVKDWVPATVMVTACDSGQFLSQLLENAKENKIWPILRLDGVPHGTAIKKDDVERFVQSLGIASFSASEFPWPIYIEFANEPNMDSEWLPKKDPVSYSESLETFIESVPPPFKILNGAMNISASDTTETMDAVNFWEQGPKRVLTKLHGLAFNPYELGAPDRLSINSWQWELKNLGDPAKPIFLLEFGLSPTKSVQEKKDFLGKEYKEYLAGSRPQLDKVEVITPLFCVDSACSQIEIPIFAFNGTVTFINPIGGTTRRGVEEEEEKEETKCGRLGSVSDIKDAADMEDCAEEAMRPYGLGQKKYDSFICKLPIVNTICRLRIDSGLVSDDLLSAKAKPGLPSPPEDLATQSASLAMEEVQAQGGNPLINWLLKIIAILTGGEKGHITVALPSKYERNNLSEMRAMGEEEGIQEDIVSDFETLRRVYTSFNLQGVAKPPGVPLPPELEPSPTPLPPEAPTPTPLPPGVPTPTPLPPGVPVPTPILPGGLWYTIEHRNASVIVGSEKKKEIVSLVLKYWPNSKIQDKWDYVEGEAIKNGWNPSFITALWIEESGASGVHAWDVGCTGAPKNNLEEGLDCLFGLSYGDKPFPEFLCRFSEGHYPCTFSINPNFPKNLKVWYDRLIPSGTPGGARPL